MNKNSVTQKNRVTASDGKIHNTEVYNLDAIIAVGYRVIQDQKYISSMDQLYNKYLEESKK